MCGIVGYVGSQRAVPVLINGLLSLEYRGYDSAGLAVLNNKNIDVFKNQGRVKNLTDNFDLDSVASTVGIAHTRWATHGKPSDLNAHPHLDNSKTFAVVHNGIIENYDKVKKFLIANGYELYSQTDTEVIPNLVHYYYNKLITDVEFRQAQMLTYSTRYSSVDDVLLALRCATGDLTGSYAIELLASFSPDQVYIAKKDSPMVVGSGEDENFIASDIPAILQHTKNFYFIEDGELGIVKPDGITFFNGSLEKIDKELKSIEWDAEASEKNGFDDYMLKEIFEQPRAIRETIGTSIVDNAIALPELDGVDFKKFNMIYIVACGTAMHAGLATKSIFENLAHIPTIVDMASEFRYRNPLIDDKTLCVFISQSGETADTIAALKLAKEQGATTISVVNVIGSSITRVSDYVLYTHAGPEIAVASTKAFTCQVTTLSILAMEIASKRIGSSIDSKIKELCKELSHMPDKVKEVLDNCDELKTLAKELYKSKDVYFTGRGYDAYVATEGALKLKEISYIHADSYPSGEFKHGPIALIEKDVPVIGIATNEDINSKTVSNLLELLTRGANVTLVTNQKIENPEIQHTVKIPECSPLFASILAIVPLQLLSYYVAKEKGLDVDKPRNLAKSVTVE